MIAVIKALFQRNTPPQTDFSEFFYGASAGEKKKLLMEVVREANKDQKALIKRYEETKAA
jgi:hypothetical protein